MCAACFFVTKVHLVSVSDRNATALCLSPSPFPLNTCAGEMEWARTHYSSLIWPPCRPPSPAPGPVSPTHCRGTVSSTFGKRSKWSLKPYSESKVGFNAFLLGFETSAILSTGWRCFTTYLYWRRKKERHTADNPGKSQALLSVSDKECISQKKRGEGHFAVVYFSGLRVELW